jgi:small GTP-binding protein
MGSATSRLSELIWPRPVRVIFVGLDGAGKTTLLSHVAEQKQLVGKCGSCLTVWPASRNPDDVETILPTCGVQMHECRVGGQSWRVFDFSGQGRYRRMWPEYYSSSAGIVFVVDASNLLRLGKVEEEFNRLLAHPNNMRTAAPCLVLLNKRDCASDTGDPPASKARVSALLRIKRRGGAQSFKVVETDGLTGDGLQAGLEWLGKEMARRQELQESEQ